MYKEQFDDDDNLEAENKWLPSWTSKRMLG